MRALIPVPDIGQTEGEVIELLVAVGDQITADQSLLVLESDKASMEIPAPYAGLITALYVRQGDRLKSGDKLMELESIADTLTTAHTTQKDPQQKDSTQNTQNPPAATPVTSIPAVKAPQAPEVPSTPQAVSVAIEQSTDEPEVHAGPAVRQRARELGITLSAVTPSGPHQRILKEDLYRFAKEQLSQKNMPTAHSTPELDYAAFGSVQRIPMSRLMQRAASNLQRNWSQVPQVTHFDQADITSLEVFRNTQKAFAQEANIKLTILPFILKCCAHLLREHPLFNSTLAHSGAERIQKDYVHIGFAVDTPEGLLVPVIRDVDQKSVLQLAREAAALAEQARRKALLPQQLQGSCFTVSSLGHIGGIGFTPLVNAPEVAILGITPAQTQPIWDGTAFQPRLMLPLSLSYDHRVINGVAAAQFTKRLSTLLADIRTLLL